MKLFLVSRTTHCGYDMYDALVVCAEAAVNIIPGGCRFGDREWVRSSDELFCVEIGEANSNQKEGSILESFNAG